MYIKIEEGIIETSEGDFIHQEDVKKVKFTTNSEYARHYVLYKLNNKEKRIYFTQDYMGLSMRDEPFYTLHLNGLSITNEDSEKIRELITEGFDKVSYARNVTYTMYNKDMIEIGSHIHTIECDEHYTLSNEWDENIQKCKTVCNEILKPKVKKVSVK